MRDDEQENQEEQLYSQFWSRGLWHILRPVLVGLTVLVLAAGICLTIWNKLYGEFAAPVDSEDPVSVEFEITSGESLNRVAANLEEAGLIRSKSIFKYYCDFAGMSQKLQIGTYTLRTDMNIAEIADRLTMGDGNPLVRNITLIPGESVEEFAAKLVRNGVLEDADTFLSLCRNEEKFTDYLFIAEIRENNQLLSGLKSSQRVNGQGTYVLEGYLAPNTYEVYVTATEEEIIRRMLSQTGIELTEERLELANDLGLTAHQVLTLASLIEKEAKKEDFARVSAVFHNRLAAGMKLESDVTIHYITGIRRMALKQEDLNTKSLYNTYLNRGLPLGPVCNPSPDAIDAALNPDPVMLSEKYLYFCAKEPETGVLDFSKTLEEHQRKVAAYAESWRKYDEARGIQ